MRSLRTHGCAAAATWSFDRTERHLHLWAEARDAAALPHLLAVLRSVRFAPDAAR